MKPLKRKNYGSIPHLLNSKLGFGDHHIDEGQHRILTEKSRPGDTVYIHEKYDGSNVGITKVNGKIIPLMRAGYTAISSPYESHHDFHKWAMRYRGIFDEFLLEGERICGEWLGSRVSIGYKIPIFAGVGPIVFFDIFNAKNERYPMEYVENTLFEYPLSVVRKLSWGPPMKVERLIESLNSKNHGHWSNNIVAKSEPPEGMVYRVENNGKFDFMAKWVRHDFVPGKFLNDKKEVAS